ncbi:hypothetical protein NW756_001727 [Fusarium oxysporum]|nr:hypothetical protein NW763_008442 [Fusarium oxysporum]KAJ4069400.1 hypothetical protein NW753_000281 [Fusarium oxysporum]KAJ4101316.1 hypothetical protein NW756_001727 [Fusarium oxysporum]KAJ4118268.1 hypothetical protein NW769_003071 [Fusarium oxysporum]KAJ4227558.1 hypothetical protein NW760_008264 [Fusarium oxysporum]
MWSDEQAAGQSQVGYAARRTRSLRGLQIAAEGDDQRPLGQGLPSDSRQRATEARRYLTCLVFARRGELVVGEVRSSDSGDTRRDWANGCIGLGSICGATGEGLRRRCSPD